MGMGPVSDANHEASSTKPIRILLVDNHEMVRKAFRTLIDSQYGMTVIADVSSHHEAVAIATAEQPDIVLLNIHPRKEDGLDFIPDLHSVARDARVLILVETSDSDVHTRAMLQGAVGVVSKEEAAEVLVKALEKVSMGEAWIDRATMANVLTELSRRNGHVEKDDESARVATLTGRELQVVSLVCAGLKNKDIAGRLFISESTARHHLSSIFSKLDVSSRLDLIIYANRRGLVDLRSSDSPSAGQPNNFHPNRNGHRA
jgi:two-component system, NarL family, nitrate/nitrite response regulator NarL